MIGLSRWSIAVVTITALACRDRAPSRRVQAAESTGLVGAWDVVLQLERPLVLVTGTPGQPREIYGHFAFVRNDTRRDGYPTIGIPDYYGTYEIDFTPFGFTPGRRGDLPSAVANRQGRDSVLIVLAPAHTTLTVVLRGSMRADSLLGTWTASSRTVGGGGSYVMRRATLSPSDP